MNCKKPGFAATFLAGVALSGGAWAQTESDEIIVTAQKREQSIQDVGIAVSALGQQALDSFDTNDSAAIALVIPSVQISQYSPAVVTTNIRGVTQSDYSALQEGPNAFYNDEVYLSSTGTIAGQMFDLERVEVLRGPQGTLFGRNATGGLVQAISAKPTRDLEGFATVTAGDYDQISTEAAIGGPISDSISGRLSLTSNHHDGYYESLNPAIEDGGNARFFGARGQLQFDLGPNDSLSLKAEYLRNDSESDNVESPTAAGLNADGLGYILGPDDTYWRDQAIIRGVDPTVWFNDPTATYANWCAGCDAAGRPSPDGPFSYNPDFAGLFDREFISLSARYEHDFGAFDFISISNVQQLDKVSHLDVDGMTSLLPHPFAPPGVPANEGSVHIANVNHMTQTSQEFRLSGQSERLNWVTGLYALRIHSAVDGQSYFDPLVAELDTWFSPDPADHQRPGAFGGWGYNAYDQTTESIAIFGQADYELNDIFTLVLGARYSSDTKDYSMVNSAVDFVSGNLFAIYDFDNRIAREQNPFTGDIFEFDFSSLAPDISKIEYNDWSGKIQLEARLNADSLLYFGISRGTKGGGYNQPVTNPVSRQYPSSIPGVPDVPAFLAALADFNAQVRFEEEVLTNYEAGFKLTLADGRLNLNGSIFHYDYDGFQAFVNSNANLLVRNVPAEIDGVELEFAARPTDALSLGGFVTYMPTAKASNVQLPSGNVSVPGAIVDRRMPQTPEWSAGVNAAYEFQLGGLGALTLSTAWKYNSEHELLLFSSPAGHQDAYTVGSVRAELNVNDNLQLAAFVNNVTDEEYAIFAADNASTLSQTESGWGRPRWAGASLTYRFGM